MMASKFFRSPVGPVMAHRRGIYRVRDAGFTLVELLAVVLVLGVLIVYYGPIGASAVGATEREKDEKNAWDIRLIADSLEAYTVGKPSYGVLPSPYTGSGYTSAVYNAADTSATGTKLAQSITASHIPATEINDDGSASANVRVYQLVTGLQYVTPFEVQSGALVTLSYQFGAIYQTACSKTDASCNPSSATGIPGTSPKLTAANYTTYQLAGTDSKLVTVSSLKIQRSMLQTTRNHLNELVEAIREDFRAKQIIAAAGDATNFYPSGTTSMGGQTPASNQGCRDGWYSLPTSGVLDNIQISSIQYGATEWGGPIEFCRDYDPLGTKTANAPPHKAALRINASVSLGLAPDPSVAGNNVFQTF
jgi:prepilin-type N-terminal cleavage/methylation domain-containing protein